ncbi:MAG: NAD(P)-dependent dehydrogenase (short-subunit alcohol dehydrogenase family) [Rhodothermales bacterium]
MTQLFHTVSHLNIPFSIDLSEKTAVVTGGSGVLCSEMAKALAACGAKVAVLSRTKAKVDAVAEAIIADGGTAMGVACDVTDRASVEAANVLITAEFGPCDILVNGAGGNSPKGTASKTHLKSGDSLDGSFFGLDAEGFRFVFDLNIVGTVLPSQIFAENMAARGTGNIINLSSMSAFTPLTKVSAYSAAKAAVNNFTQWLAVHLSGVGIRVNAIAPGFFLSEQNRSLLTNEDGSLTDRGNTIISQTPMGEFGTPDQLLGTLLWLASDAASGFVTGTIIPVDGGFSAFSGV